MISAGFACLLVCCFKVSPSNQTQNIRFNICWSCINSKLTKLLFVSEPPKLLFSARLTFFLMVLFVMFTSMLQRLNINFALVCMVKSVSTNVTNLLELDYDETSTNYTLQTNHSSLLSNENTDEVSCKPSSSLNQSHTVNPLEVIN